MSGKPCKGRLEKMYLCMYVYLYSVDIFLIYLSGAWFIYLLGFYMHYLQLSEKQSKQRLK